MASAAAKKPSKRGKRRTDARRKRVARPGAKPARRTPSRPRAAAKKRVAKKLAKAKRALTIAVAKRRVKKRVASLKRTVAKRVVRARTRVKSATKRMTTAGALVRKRVTKSVKSAKKRMAAAGVSVRKRVTKSVKSATKRATMASASARKRVAKTVTSAKRALERAAARRVPRPVAAPKPVPPAFAAQRASATAREVLLFELQRARASVKAATQGIASGAAERPIAPGKWSIKEIVLHLSERDRVRLEELSRTLGGQSRSWAGIEDPEMGAHNEAHLSPLRAHGWDDALRRLDSMREQLLLRLSEVPAEPDDVWRRGHPFADMMWGLPEHDRHHASQIKLARIGATGPVED